MRRSLSHHACYQTRTAKSQGRCKNTKTLSGKYNVYSSIVPLFYDGGFRSSIFLGLLNHYNCQTLTIQVTEKKKSRPEKVLQ